MSDEPKSNPREDSEYLRNFTDEHLTKLRLNATKSIRNLKDYVAEIDLEITRRDMERQPKLFDVEGT